MKNKSLITLLLTLIIGLKQTQAQFYNQGSEVTIQAGATVTVEGNFYNKAGSDFKNAGTIELKSEVANDQSMIGDHGGYWIFNGANLQKIGGIEPIWMNTLRFDNPMGFILQNSLILSKQLEFNAGVMTAENPGNIVYFTSSAVIGSPAPSHDSHINGEVVKEGDSQIFTYPIGDATHYQPIEVNFTTNENGLLGKYSPTDGGSAGYGTSGSEATPLISYNTKEHWNLTPINAGSVKAKVKVFWDGYQDSGATDPQNLNRVAHLATATGKWENEGTNTGSTGASGSVTSNQIADWSPFTLGAVALGNPLPITLISFTGKKVGNYNQLNWQTSSEINASHFEVERSSPLTPDGGISNEKFVKIGEVKATKSERYRFDDNSSFIINNSSLVFYRLKLIDIDGKFAYSKIIYLQNNTDNELVGQFYPNPSQENYSNINITAEQKGEWQITKMDIMGRTIKTEKRILEKGVNTITIYGLEKGLNIVQFENEKNSEIRKLIR